jgi:hypothetical protein
MGTLIQKIQREFSSWVTAPPMSGPQATARPAIPPQIPTTAPRRSLGNAAESRVRPSGMMIAAPMPWNTRKAMSAPAVGAKAQAADEMVKRARPQM